jgi:2-oxoglutarate dehydrogenase E2 component (dihydrolipoamide succinyltransferase)
MAKHHLILPKMGESVSEATIIKWLKQPGERVEEDEAVLEIATDKVDSDVPSPVAGVISELLFDVDAVVQVGQVLAVIETDAGAVEQAAGTVSAEPVAADTTQATPSVISSSNNEEKTEVAQVEDVPFVPASNVDDAVTAASRDLAGNGNGNGNGNGSDRFYSPLVKSIAQEEGISKAELDRIAGTGADNRVTKQDILNYIASRATKGQQSAERPSTNVQDTVPTPAAKVQSTAVATPIALNDGDEIIEMDRMRRLIADHMVASVQTSPHVCSFVEADVTNLVNWRNKVKGSFEKREGEKITFTPVFIEAVSKAIRDFPMINVSVDGYRIIKKKNINIGMATALPSGNLIVPVIKNADQLSLVGITKTVNDLAKRARANKLRPDDTQGTNIGAFGNIMGTPIINQPQVAILAVGTITKKPAVVETEFGDMIAIRHKMYLSLSYDHRVVDGSLGGQFVKRVADYLEAWDVNREL